MASQNLLNASATLLHTEEAQIKALDANAHVWVSASAGTGKTKVLIDRVLTLFLEGVSPEKVLCLTFTKAAASEMLKRLLDRLALWATCDEERLQQDLKLLTGHLPAVEQQKKARLLFTHVLNIPKGLKVQTIHSFCQSILKRFPLESGISPYFEVVDEVENKNLLNQALETVLLDKNFKFIDDLRFLTGSFEIQRFKELVYAFIFSSHRLRKLAQRGLKDALAFLEEFLGISLNESKDDFLAHHCQEVSFAFDGLKKAVFLLGQGSAEDVKKAAIMQQWLESPGERKQLFPLYESVFLKVDGEIRSRLATKKVLDMDSALLSILLQEAERVYTVSQKLKSIEVGKISAAFLRLGIGIYSVYENLKQKKAVLDYDDLINRTCQLLLTPGLRDWVLYKLDDKIDHILVDEAQDTNTLQWDIIKALTEEFFSGHTARDNKRTIFTVGDEKQSIYSFQGAEPHVFSKMQDYFGEKANACQQSFLNIQLERSFRSTPVVLKAVDAIFSHPLGKEGVLSREAVSYHSSFRQGYAGRVEVWPLAEAKQQDQDNAVFLQEEERSYQASSSERLADFISYKIKDWLNKKEKLPSKGRPIQPSDIMILVQRRGQFMHQMIRALKRREIPVTSADRFILTDQIAIHDLMALGYFLLLPEDNFNLACLLKSPLLDLSEEDVFDLCYEREGASLWTVLKERASKKDKFLKAYTFLSSLLNKVDLLSPFELYADVLENLKGRQQFIGRLGAECVDVLNEFLALCLRYEEGHTPSLEGFLYWIKQGEVEIKRDFSQTMQDQVRVMTIHGAKGLQAPIVFLADTVRVPGEKEEILWKEDQHRSLMLWCPAKEKQPSSLRKLRQEEEKRTLEEYRRLFYVALTRAEDCLYICGWKTARPLQMYNWYEWARESLTATAQPFAFDCRENIREGWVGEGLVFSEPQEAPLQKTEDRKLFTLSGQEKVPAWAFKETLQEQAKVRPLNPSKNNSQQLFLDDFDPRDKRFETGKIIHKFLEKWSLQNPLDEKEILAVLKAQAPSLEDAQQKRILRIVISLFKKAELKECFGQNSYAEVPIVGKIGPQTISAQVDRLVVMPDKIYIIDYKSHQNPPSFLDAVPEAYLSQMAIYQQLVSQMFPQKKIVCFLLWLENTHLMELPEMLLSRYTL